MLREAYGLLSLAENFTSAMFTLTAVLRKACVGTRCSRTSAYLGRSTGMTSKILPRNAFLLDPRLMKDSMISVNNKNLEGMLGCILRFSVNYWLFQLEGLASHCEDYGEAVIHKGTC